MFSLDLPKIFSNAQYVDILLHGIKLTFSIAISSWLLAMSLAVLLLAIRMTPGFMGIKIGEIFVKTYVSYHRNVPTLVQILLWYFGIYTLLPREITSALREANIEAIFAVIALGLCQAAYFTEDLRSGLRSVSKGQWEAARALGHSFISTYRYILLPQGVRNATPPLINHSISLFKNSSLAMAIGAAELTYAVKEIENLSFMPFEIYFIGAGLYLIFSLLLMAMASWIEVRTALPGQERSRGFSPRGVRGEGAPT